jgi:tetratricopeptide (TPR) repeat protein
VADPVDSSGIPPHLAGDARERRARLLALAAALLAIAIRLPHLGWGLPDLQEEALPLKWAFEMGGWGGGGLLNVGHPAAADTLCRQLLARDPDDFRAEGLLGRAAEMEGDRDRAICHYSRGLALAQELIDRRAAGREASVAGSDAPAGDLDPAAFSTWANGRLAELRRAPPRGPQP